LKLSSKERNKIALRMIGFPVVYLFTYFPMGLIRILNFFTKEIPREFIAYAVLAFVTNGFLNALNYGHNRRIFHRAYKTLFMERKPSPEERPWVSEQTRTSELNDYTIN